MRIWQPNSRVRLQMLKVEVLPTVVLLQVTRQVSTEVTCNSLPCSQVGGRGYRSCPVLPSRPGTPDSRRRAHYLETWAEAAREPGGGAADLRSADLPPAVLQRRRGCGPVTIKVLNNAHLDVLNLTRTDEESSCCAYTPTHLEVCFPPGNMVGVVQGSPMEYTVHNPSGDLLFLLQKEADTLCSRGGYEVTSADRFTPITSFTSTQVTSADRFTPITSFTSTQVTSADRFTPITSFTSTQVTSADRFTPITSFTSTQVTSADRFTPITSFTSTQVTSADRFTPITSFTSTQVTSADRFTPITSFTSTSDLG
nr:uncharacterized protein LOC113819207 [Penaeus vannamei]